MSLFDSIMALRKGVVFRWEGECYGSCVPNSKEEPIVINLIRHYRCDPLRTFVHECIHLLHPKLSERNVRKYERYVWNSLTAKQQFLLGKKLYNGKWRTR